MKHVFSLAGSLSQDIATMAGYPVLVGLVVVMEDLDLLTIHYLLLPDNVCNQGRISRPG